MSTFELPRGASFAVIGSGAMAVNLTAALLRQGYQLAQVYSRTAASAEQLVQQAGQGQVIASLPALNPDCRLVLLAVSDDALPEVVAHLQALSLPETLFLHTAGSVPLSVLAPLGEQVGVIWPMLTLSRHYAVSLAEVPLFYEGTDVSRAAVGRLARQLSEYVYETSSEQRGRLHVGAVMAANFVNYLVGCAGELAEGAGGANYRVYLPLLQEVVRRLEEMPPQEAQTGPAMRGDRKTLERQEALLQQSHPHLAELYALLSRQILERYHPSR